MKIELKVPVLPESVSEAVVAHWHYKIGDFVPPDVPVVDIETDKVILEVAATQAGVLTEISFQKGDKVTAQQSLGSIEPSEAPAASVPAQSEDVPAAAPLGPSIAPQPENPNVALRPSVRKALHEKSLNIDAVVASAPDKNHVTIEDVAAYEKNVLENPGSPEGGLSESSRQQRRESLSPLRQKIAQRLLSAQHNAAMLTTFNEVDMSAVMGLRERHKVDFEKKFGVKMGFMGFFMKAVSLSLESYPTLNAYIDRDEIVFHNSCDIGIAVSSERGLVVPVVRDVQNLPLEECEKTLAALAEKARSGKITMSDLTGGTFTITNGGVFGSLLSTPILNPPQSAILGMHKIQERAVVVDHQVVIRPMMYVALSYDHRLIDGAQAVSFLVNVKRALEQPEQIFLHLL